MIAAAEPAIKQEETRKRGWALSTATTSGDEPVHRQKYAITEPLVAIVEPVYRPHMTRSSLAWEWVATLDALQLNFAELVSQYSVTRDLAVHSPVDEPDVAAHWAALLRRPLRLPRSAEEDMLDWNVGVSTPRSRPMTTVLASVEYRGRPKPTPFVDPWD